MFAGFAKILVNVNLFTKLMNIFKQRNVIWCNDITQNISIFSIFLVGQKEDKSNDDPLAFAMSCSITNISGELNNRCSVLTLPTQYYKRHSII